MGKKITLTEASEAWGEWKVSAGDPGEHIPPGELYEFLLHPADYADRENLLGHLTRCPLCLRELEDMSQSVEEAAFRMWDLALPKAAASDMEGPWKIATEDGKYTIEIRPHISDENRGIITVQVSPQNSDALEGKTVTLKDSQGRVLLKGRIINSEVSQEIDGLDRIEYGLVIQSE